jgi:hypothetical protein
LLSPTMPSVSGLERTAFNTIEVLVRGRENLVGDLLCWDTVNLLTT